MMGFETVLSRASVLPDAPGEDVATTSSSSSIGRNSDVSSERSAGEGESAENEAESAYNGPLHAMETLEEVLPIRRGISKFYNGKSKSFTSLAEAASTPSLKDIVKPENAYSRRRRNLMALNHVLDKSRNYPLRSNSGGISKRSMSLSRSALALAVAMNNSDSSSSFTSEDSGSSPCSSLPLPLPSPLPPLHPRNRVSSSVSPLQQNFSSWRSFSMADLQQHCAIAATIKMSSSSSIGNEIARGS